MHHAANLATTPAVHRSSLAEQRVVFHHLNWQSYEQILQALNQGRSSRLIYDQGTLEITMPLEKHEFATRLMELFIRILVMELGLKIKTMGSTTLNFPQLDRSAEPDNGYYIQNQPKVAGKDVDLTCDPPPDLVVAVDITHTEINKLTLYASMGVPEYWRYNGRLWQIYQLVEKEYVEMEHSPNFPWVEKEKLYQFLADCREDEIAAEKSFRAWVQEQVKQRSSN
jgi:Uma2 family endonuclease